MKENQPQGRMQRGRVVVISLLVIASLVAGLFIPWNLGVLTSHPNPVKDYAEAVQRIDVLKASRASEMNPACQTEFMTHGEKVENVIIMVHGYTNCPAQFQELGQQFYNLGYNVLIAPLPHHGLADRMNVEQAHVTAQELTQYADQMVDIAQGLGNDVSMMGISMGGVTTAWAAQHRSDLDTAVIISPAFGYQAIPTALTAPVMNYYLLAPVSFVWWDPALQENVGPAYAYPRYSKRTLAQTLRLSFSVQTSARHSAPAAKRVIVVTNADDTSVNNALTAKVVAQWQKDGAQIETYEYPSRLKLGHDLIDPNQSDQQIDVVYPELIKLVTQ
jgi:carboxylesterase